MNYKTSHDVLSSYPNCDSDQFEEALEIALEVLKKFIAVAPYERDLISRKNGLQKYGCPMCSRGLPDSKSPVHCSFCGQLINFSLLK